MLNVFSSRLQTYGADLAEHGEPLREFSAPHLRPLYVERPMFYMYGDPANGVHVLPDNPLTYSERRSRFMSEFGRLRAAGVRLPWFYVVGGREYGENGTRVVAQKITPVSFDQVSPIDIRERAAEQLRGMMQYLDDTETGQDMLWDFSAMHQQVFGVDRLDPEPAFYDVDLGGRVTEASERQKRFVRCHMKEFAREVDITVGDGSLSRMVYDYAYNQAMAVA